MIQIARYGAVYGVSFVVAAVVERCSPSWSSSGAAGRAPSPASGTAALLALVLDARAVAARADRPPEAGRLRVGLVQASIAQDEKWDAGPRLGERGPPPGADAPRRRRRARGSWSGRSPRCRSSSTACPSVAAQLRDLVRRARRSTSSSATTTARTAPAGARPHLGRGEDARPARRASSCAITRSGSCRSASTCPSSPCSLWAAASRPSSCRRRATSRPGDELRAGAGGRPPGGRLHLLRGDLPRPRARVRGARRAAPRQHHQRRLVRTHLRPLPALRDGQVPRGGERALPGAGGQHRHHRRRGSARPGGGADGALRARRSSSATCPSLAGTTFYSRHGRRLRLGVPGGGGGPAALAAGMGNRKRPAPSARAW